MAFYVKLMALAAPASLMCVASVDELALAWAEQTAGQLVNSGCPSQMTCHADSFTMIDAMHCEVWKLLSSEWNLLNSAFPRSLVGIEIFSGSSRIYAALRDVHKLNAAFYEREKHDDDRNNACTMVGMLVLAYLLASLAPHGVAHFSPQRD